MNLSKARRGHWYLLRIVDNNGPIHHIFKHNLIKASDEDSFMVFIEDHDGEEHCFKLCHPYPYSGKSNGSLTDELLIHINDHRTTSEFMKGNYPLVESIRFSRCFEHYIFDLTTISEKTNLSDAVVNMLTSNDAVTMDMGFVLLRDQINKYGL